MAMYHNSGPNNRTVPQRSSVQALKRSTVAEHQRLSVQASRLNEAFQCLSVEEPKGLFPRGSSYKVSAAEINSRLGRLFPSMCQTMIERIDANQTDFLVIRGRFDYNQEVRSDSFTPTYTRSLADIDIVQIYPVGFSRIYRFTEDRFQRVNEAGKHGFDGLWRNADTWVPLKLYDNYELFAADYFDLLI